MPFAVLQVSEQLQRGFTTSLVYGTCRPCPALRLYPVGRLITTSCRPTSVLRWPSGSSNCHVKHRCTRFGFSSVLHTRQFCVNPRHGSNKSSSQLSRSESNSLKEVISGNTGSNDNVFKARFGCEEPERYRSFGSRKSAYDQGILITGGTSGIGYAIARRALIEKAPYIRIITRDRERGLETVDKLYGDIRCDYSPHIDFMVAETKDYSNVNLFQHSYYDPAFTTIIHCAGITQTSLLASTRDDDIQKILSVNLESAALLSKTHLKRYARMLARPPADVPDEELNPDHGWVQPARGAKTESWQIINVASLLANKGGYGSSIYAASKAGLIALTRAAALEGAAVTKRHAAQAPGFRANVVVPGYIETPMTDNFAGQSREKLVQEIPAGRFGTPDEVADAVMFLLGNEYANNCVLNLDGGLSAV